MTDKSTQDGTDEPGFAVFLCDHAKGRTERELSEALAEITREVIRTRKAGKLQLTISIAPQKGVTNAVMIHDDVKKQVPQYDRASSIFYATEEGELSRDDPTQTALPLYTENRPAN